MIRNKLRGAAMILTAPVLFAVRASETMPSRLYEVTTETGMPHLEENLRYTTQRDQRCLTNQSLSDSFPILSHPALQGCRLQDEMRQGDTVSYTLVCEGGHGTTGQAIWHLDEHRILGTLNIKLGGNYGYQESMEVFHEAAPPRAERRGCHDAVPKIK
jgi:hypothetical protein